jgi:ketopantoate reductase
MMQASPTIGSALAIEMNRVLKKLIDRRAALGNFKSSTIQNLKRDRPMQIDAFLGVIAELRTVINIDIVITRRVLLLHKWTN